jgi:nucleotide-binding universal stress UspA family protein
VLRPVVVGLDGSSRSCAAADWAAREALRRGLSLQVVQAWEGVTSPCDRERPELNEPRCLARHALTDAADRLRATYPKLSVCTRHIAGSATDVLIAVGAGAELLVLGSRAVGGVGGFIAGSVAQVVAGHVSRPVVLVRDRGTLEDEHLPDAEGLPSTHTLYRDVVVGVDPGHASEELLAFAFESAARCVTRHCGSSTRGVRRMCRPPPWRGPAERWPRRPRGRWPRPSSRGGRSSRPWRFTSWCWRAGPRRP